MKCNNASLNIVVCRCIPQSLAKSSICRWMRECKASEVFLVFMNDEIPVFKKKNNEIAALIMWFDCEKIIRLVGKKEIAGYQHFLLFLQCFQKFSFSGC